MKQYMAQHGTSYYVGSMFFPAQIKKDVFTLYAFVRVPDNIVDQPSRDIQQAKQTLDQMREIFLQAYTHQKLPPHFFRGGTLMERADIAVAAALVFQKYEIPLAWVEDFFAAMEADLDKKTYATYAELQQYMYGSAEVIWLMMCKIIWYATSQEAEVFRTAKALGEAMQYTNFLSDIVEDQRDHDRLYIPEDRLSSHYLSHALLSQYIAGKEVDDQRRSFMTQQVLQCKELYREANKGIDLLHPQGRTAVRVASWMYESILDKIVRNGYDVFRNSARTTKREKAITLLSKGFRYFFMYSPE
jgi:15-cis-phytoene synthase